MDTGKKLLQTKLDAKKNRLNHPIEFIKTCKACSIEFKTYYPQKEYCGAKECDKVRVFIKNQRIQARRSKQYMLDKGRNYYKNNKEKCLLSKAEYYRKKYPDAKEYISGKPSRLTFEYVKNYIEENNYKLLSDDYINNSTKLLLECPKGHRWLTSFHNFKDGNNSRCLHCYASGDYVSSLEKKVRDFFLQNYPKTNIEYNNRTILLPRELDIYFPDNKLAIELCGLYWHGDASGKERSYHYNKMVACFNEEIRLITVFEDELNNNFDIVMSRILNALGIHNARIYARKCDIVELTSSEANKFFIENHIQGKSTAIKAWGLVYNKELVAIGSVGIPSRKHTSNGKVLELKRFCTKRFVSVIGGVGKLFKRVIKFAVENNYDMIKSYCDMRYANIIKPVYESIGFELQEYTKYTPHYTKNGVRYRNLSLRKTPEERITGKTEWQLREAQGYDRIWDCGHRTYVYKLTNLLNVYREIDVN